MTESKSQSESGSKPILRMFWIAEYEDGLALPQFDPDTGEEHLFKDVDQAKLARFGWYAFPPQLAEKVPNAIANPNLRSYTIDLSPVTRLIAHRTTTITFSPKELTVEHHEADEYVLGLTCHCEERSDEAISMHIYTDGRVELKWQQHKS